MNVKSSLVVGATIATVVAGGIGGITYAATTTTTSSGGNTTLVDKIASRFHLNKSDVQAVFDQDRQAHREQMHTEQQQRLTDAVAAGSLTQAQADHILSVQQEIRNLMGSANPHELSDSVRQQIMTKREELHSWAQTNNISLQDLMGPRGDNAHHGGRMGMGHHDEIETSTSTD